MRVQQLILPSLLLLTAVAYWPGLAGPFMFDDGAHVHRNELAAIDDLSPASLLRAWNSSPSPFPANRPLAQLSFGINHALHGPRPFGYKLVNLAIHLLCGVAMYFLVLRLLRCARDPDEPADGARIAALVAAGIWLVHPLNLSTVLYVVQRMAQLSTLSLLCAMLLYVHGRGLLARDARGLLYMLAAYLCAAVAFLAKENAVLFPLFVAVLEATLLSRLAVAPALRARWRAFLLLLVGLPLVLGVFALLGTPEYLQYEGRPFTLEERVLTQSRVLWFYLRMFLVPDIGALGFYHDDFALSRGLLQPWTTLAAIAAWLALLAAALFLRRRRPVFAFAVLFFLAAHALESGVIPLEMIFEHRNYLPLLGPATLLGWLATRPRNRRKRFATLALVAVFGLMATMVTWMRAGNWSSMTTLTFVQADNHPGSPRANFQAAQVAISGIPYSAQKAELGRIAEDYLERALAAEPDYIDPLFGHLVLAVFLNRAPPVGLVDRLEHQLRWANASPTRFTVSQLSYLVRLQIDSGEKLPRDTMHRLFRAVLANPSMHRYGLAGMQSAYRAYYDRVLGMPAAGLPHAQRAVELWPERWHYREKQVDLLIRLGHFARARRSIATARQLDPNGLYTDRLDVLEQRLRLAEAAGTRE